MIIKCKECGATLERKTVSSGNATGIAVALIVFAIGVFLCTTCVGAIIGIPMCICALFMGGKRTKIWYCPECGTKAADIV